MTKTERLLRFLRYREDGATGMDFVRAGVGIDYRKRISLLKKQGYNIIGSWERSGLDRYKRYILKEG